MMKFTLSFIVLLSFVASVYVWRSSDFASDRAPASVTSNCFNTLEKLIKPLSGKTDLKRVFISDSRIGQSVSYDSFLDIIHGINPNLEVGRFSHNSIPQKIKAGDVYIFNVYSDALDKVVYRCDCKPCFLDRVQKAGAKIVVEIENTRASIIESGERERAEIKGFVEELHRYNVPFVVYEEDVLQFLSKEIPSGRFTLMPHLEKVSYLRKSGALTDYLDMLDQTPAKKRVLYLEQYHKEGREAAINFMRYLMASHRDEVSVVLAVHPHSSMEKYERLIKEAKMYGLEMIAFQSGSQLKSNEFFPFVDGVVSLSSTLLDIADDAGVPVLKGVQGKSGRWGFANPRQFIDSLTVSTRSKLTGQFQNDGFDCIDQWLSFLQK